MFLIPRVHSQVSSVSKLPTSLLNILSSMACCHPLSTPRKLDKKTNKKTAMRIASDNDHQSFSVRFLKKAAK